MNTYKTSKGERVTQSQIDKLTREAKAKVLENQIDRHGYNFCVKCGKNHLNTYLDCSHTISVKKAKETGRTELAWCTDNIKIRCRECHQELDGLNIKN